MNTKKVISVVLAFAISFSYMWCVASGDILQSNINVAYAVEEKNAQGYTKLDTLKEDPNAPDPKKSKNKGVTYIEGVMMVNKTYDLPEDFEPEDMHKDNTCELGSGYGGTNGLDNTAYTQAIKLMKAADKDGISLNVVSGYRSYDYQKNLYNDYVNQSGKEKADTFSARPGFSEHQTGLSLDFNMASSNFDDTKEAKWLEQHAHEYGFIIRYPKGKTDYTGYKYESWHVRYIGGAKAKAVYESGVTLEEYLGITSKYGDPKIDGDALDAPVNGNSASDKETTWKRKSGGEEDYSSWLNVKDDWRHGIASSGNGGGSGPSGSTGHGKATGQYAIDLCDGSWYWYHQGSDECQYCGSWCNKYWGIGLLSSNGCPIYATSIIVSNLIGEEITPDKLLTNAGSIEVNGSFSRATLNPGGFAGEATVISHLKSQYGLEGEIIDWGSKESAKEQVDKILDKGGMILYYHYYGTDTSRGMFEIDGNWWPFFKKSEGCHFIPIRAKDSEGYYLLDECQKDFDKLNIPVSWDAIWKCKLDGKYGNNRTMIGIWNPDAE